MVHRSVAIVCVALLVQASMPVSAGIFDNVLSAGSDLVSGATGAVKKVAGGVASAGSNLVQGNVMAAGGSLVKGAASAGGQLVSGTANAAKDLFGLGGSGEGDTGDSTADESAFTTDIANGLDDAHAPAFTLTDKLYLVYKSDAERDNVLAKVLQLWRNALVPYQALSQKVQINFVRASSVAGSSVANQMLVIFTVSGQSRLRIDFTAAKASFHAVIEASHMGDVENAPDSAEVGGESENKVATEQPADSGIAFEITDTITLTFTIESQRDAILQQLLAIWTTSLSSYQAINLKITFVKQEIDSGSSGSLKIYIVTYTVSGSSTTEVDQEAAKKSFHEALITAHITGVYVDIRINDSITLTYSDEAERQSFLDQLLVIWRTTLVSYKVIDITIEFQKEEPDTSSPSTGSSKTYIVTYIIIFKSSTPVDEDEAKGKFKRSLEEAHFVGGPTTDGPAPTDPPSDDSNSGSDSSSDDSNFLFEISDSISISYKNPQDRDNILQKLLAFWKLALGGQVVNLNIVFISEKVDPSAKGSNGKVYIVKYRIDGQSAKPVDEGQARIEFQKSVDSANMPELSLSTSKNIVDTGFSYLVTDNVDIVLNYKSSKERDTILSQLFAVCRKVLGDLYQATDLEIIFDGMKPATSSGAGKTATFSYHLSYSTQTPIDVDKIKAAIEKEIASARISGLVSLTIHSSGDTDDSGSDSDSSSITLVSSSVVLTYSNKAQRDSLLNRILTVWRTVFSKLGRYDVINLKIVFDSEELTTPSGSGSDKTYIVKYHITGHSEKSVDEDLIETEFKKDITETHISGVVSITVIINGKPSTLKFGGGPSGKGSWTEGGSGSWSLLISGSITLTYDNPKQRDDLLQQILLIWKKTLSITYTITDLRIIFDKEVKSGKSFIVTYHITGKTNKPIDEDKVKVLFKRSLEDAHIPNISTINITITITISGGGGGGTPAPDAETTPAPDAETTPAPDAETTPGPDARDDSGSWSLLISGSITLTYNNPKQRDDLLQQILLIWKKTLSITYTITDLRIIFDKEVKSGKSFIVTYHITGKTNKPIDEDKVKVLFKRSLEDAHIPNILTINITITITISGDGGGGTPAPDAETTPAPDAETTPAPDAETTPAPDAETTPAPDAETTPGPDAHDDSGSWSLLISGSITLTYDNPKQRDDLLQQILLIWKKTLSITYTITDLRIIFDKEVKSGKSFIVTYHITGKTNKPIDEDKIKVLFKRSLEDAHIPNVSTINITITITISGGGDATPAPDAETTPAPDTETTPSDEPKTTPSPKPSGGGRITFTITDTITLTYTTTQQRDLLLQQILAIWRKTLSVSYTIIELTIVFDRAEMTKTSPNGKITYTVTYHITGKSNKPVDPEPVKKVFKRSVDDANIDGVSTVIIKVTGGGVVKPIPTPRPNKVVTFTTPAPDDDTTPDESSWDITTITITFTITDIVTLTYSNENERNALLDQILIVWKKSLISRYHIVDLKIIFDSETPSPATNGGVKIWFVTYHITGKSNRPVDADKAKTFFKRSLDDEHIPGVTNGGGYISSRLTISGSGIYDINRWPDRWGNLDAVIDGFKTQFTFKLFDTQLILYSTNGQLMSALEQLRIKWINAIHATSTLRAWNVRVNVVKDMFIESEGVHMVIYSVSGSSTEPFELSSSYLARNEFQRYMLDAHITVIDGTGSGVQKKFSISTETNTGGVPDWSTSMDTFILKTQSLRVFSIQDVFLYTVKRDADDYISGLKSMWSMALGNDALFVDVSVVDDSLVLDADLKLKATHSMTYIVNVVSKLDYQVLRLRFEQYLVTKVIQSCQSKTFCSAL